MSDLIVAAWPPGRDAPYTVEALGHAALALAPPGLKPYPPLLKSADGFALAVANPVQGGVRVESSGVCLGAVIGDSSGWASVGAPAPDGTYAMCRFGEHQVELLSDTLATRTIWYVHTPDLFLASTSQRAIVRLLGDFKPNEEAVAWMITSGTTGVDCSWDVRLKRLPADSRLTLERATGRLRVVETPVVFEPAPGGPREHVQRLREAIEWSCSHMAIDPTRWLLPLSGGSDSRVILAFMAKHGIAPRTITWTTRASLRQPLSDAQVAVLLARRFGVAHEFRYLDFAAEAPREVLGRFVAAAEGRVAHFAGYVDGMNLWRELFEAGVQGVVRGDESCGVRRRAASEEGARRACEQAVVADYPESHLIRRLGLAEQLWPERLRLQGDEGFESYRDRMEQQVYEAAILAPLNAAKCRYVEVVNPLQTKRVITVVRALPDELRMYGRAFLDVVGSQTRPIPYARFSSVPAESAYLHHPAYVVEMVREVSSHAAGRVLPEAGVEELLAAAACHAEGAPPIGKRALRLMKAALPARLAHRLKGRYEGPEPLPVLRVLFRTYVASRALAMFESEAAS